MKKSKAMSIIIIVVVSILLILLLAKLLLDGNDDINQGSFRVNDLVIESSLDVEELTSQDENASGFDSISLNLSQRNNISMLVANKAKIKDIYIDNLSISMPKSEGNVVFYQNGAEEEKIDISAEQIKIYQDEQEGQILINLNIDNLDFLKDVKLPSDTKMVTYDGTLIKTLNLNLNDLKIKMCYNINIVDGLGKLNVCKIDLTMPDEDLRENGISIKRKKLADFKFSVEDNFIKKWINKLPFKI